MEKLLVFTIVGLSLAAIYSIISSGLVLTYTTTGIFNFAHGAAGMLAAFTYWQLRFDWGWPAPVALFVVLVVLAPALGLLLERVIMRGLVGTTEATKLVVSISLLVGMIGLANVIWKPGVSRPMATFFQGQTIDLGVTTITYHQAITIAVAILVAVGLRLLLFRTRMGVSMRANVDDRTLALLNGARPDRVAIYSWAVGSSLAALGGILIAPSIALDAASLSLVIVNAYAAAIFGRLRSLPLTFVGAVVIGLAEGYLFGYLPGDNPYLIGLRPAASVIILFLVLLMLPNPRLRTHGRLREFFPAPSMRGALLFAASALAGGVVMATTLGEVDLITYGQIFSIGIIALSLVPLVGLAGQISLAQLGFAGIGAVVMAHQGAGGNPLGVVLAVVVCAGVGALVALPVLRLSGIYLALATAAFAVALDRWIFNLPDFDVGPLHISMFTQGSVDVVPLRVFGYAFDTPARQLLLANVAFVAVAMLVVAGRRSVLVRRLLAIRDSEAADATFGLNLVVTRLGLVGGALFAGASLNGLLPFVATLGDTAARLSSMAPGLVGIGLGRNPSGAVQDMNEGVAPLRRDPAALAGMFGLMALWYALRLADVITNWPFVILLALTFVAANVSAMLRARPPKDAVEPEPALEWVGITSPWTPERVVAIDRALALDQVRVRAPT